MSAAATVVDAAVSDAAAIRSLLAQLHPEAAEQASLPVVRQESRTLLAKAGEETVGLLLATFVDYGIESYGMIEELVVDEAHRSRGYGRLLLAECRRWFTGLRADVVFVSALPDAEEFYLSSGFARCVGPWLHCPLRSRT